jgi:anti-sigma factor RsiW
MNRMSCADVEAHLVLWDDDAAARAAVEAHLSTCAACQALAADLSAIRAAAADLPVLAPPPVVWTRLRPRVTVAAASRFGLPTSWLAAAAALLLAVGAALGMLAAGRAPTGSADGDASVAEVAADLEAAEAHYLRAIAGLEQIARTDDAALDPQVAAVLRANLPAIDAAIRETRWALQARPDDDVARRGLFEALDGKVALLEQTVSLIDAERVLDDPAPRPQD